MKKALSILLALFMILFTINVPVFAMDLGDIQDMIDSGNTEITLDGHIVDGVSSEEALKNGIALAGEGEKVYIEISDSFEITEPITIPSGVTVELDLNGFTLSHEKACTKSYQMIENNGTLKIQDSSENADGKISFTDTGEGDPN